MKSPVSTTDKIRISVQENNQLAVNDEPVKDFEALDTLLKQLLAVKKPVLIYADKSINYGLVIKVMDIAQKNGAEKLELTAKNQNDEKAD